MGFLQMNATLKMTMIVVGSFFFSGPALAAPTYLNCEFISNGSPFAVNLSADEAEGAVTMSMPAKGYSKRVRANFTADSVLFADDYMQYELNRINLSIVRVISIIKSTERGTCKIQEAPKRAF
jgi:hypothetical protein